MSVTEAGHKKEQGYCRRETVDIDGRKYALVKHVKHYMTEPQS